MLDVLVGVADGVNASVLRCVCQIHFDTLDAATVVCECIGIAGCVVDIIVSDRATVQRVSTQAAF